MNLVKSFISALAIALLFASCTKFQYATLSGDLITEDAREFVFENDSLKIDYWFTGHGGPINIKIYNKLKQPIYVDWSKSALIMNEKRYAYWSDQSSLTTSTIEYGSSIGAREGFNETTGTISKKEKVSFIPPASSVSVSPIYLKSDFFKPEYTRHHAKEKTSIGGVKAIQYQYQVEDSPLRFRSFLTLSDQEDFSTAMYIDSKFWVTEITNTQADPAWIMQKSRNQFYLSEVTAYGKGVIGIAMLMFLTGYVILESAP